VPKHTMMRSRRPTVAEEMVDATAHYNAGVAAGIRQARGVFEAFDKSMDVDGDFYWGQYNRELRELFEALVKEADRG
jgi:hypothetical protein